MFGFFEVLLVLVLEFDKVLDQIFYLLVFFAVNLSQMVDFTFFFLQIIGDACVLVLVWLEFIFERLVFEWELVDVGLDLWDFAADFAVSVLVVPYSFVDAFQLVVSLVILWV